MSKKRKRRKKKKLHLFSKFIFILSIVICGYLIYEYRTTGNFDKVIQVISNIKFNKINTEEKSFSSNNLVKGQNTISGKDGYTTIYTTLSDNYSKTYKEFKQNGNSSWSENNYWGGTMSKNGCGITSMSIVASGYGLDITPEDLRKKYYPHLDGDDMQQELKKMGIDCTEFYYHKSYLSKKYVIDWLKTNRPIIICVGNNKENIWTSSSHYMVLLDINEDGFIYISNPNRIRW